MMVKRMALETVLTSRKIMAYNIEMMSSFRDPFLTISPICAGCEINSEA